MSFLPIEYKEILLFAIITFCVALVLAAIAVFLSVGEVYPEKLSAYECGFNPFSDARHEFEIKFYTTAILFVIFDVEVALLLPLTEFLQVVNVGGLFPIFLFLVLLIIALWYEMYVDALDWK